MQNLSRVALLLIHLIPAIVVAAPTLLPPNVSEGGYLTATDFGADPTGRNDSQAAFQTALTQAKNQSTHLFRTFYTHSTTIAIRRELRRKRRLVSNWCSVIILR
jgi:hypothetical protein